MLLDHFLRLNILVFNIWLDDYANWSLFVFFEGWVRAFNLLHWRNHIPTFFVNLLKINIKSCPLIRLLRQRRYDLNRIFLIFSHLHKLLLLHFSARQSFGIIQEDASAGRNGHKLVMVQSILHAVFITILTPVFLITGGNILLISIELIISLKPHLSIQSFLILSHKFNTWSFWRRWRGLLYAYSLFLGSHRVAVLLSRGWSFGRITRWAHERICHLASKSHDLLGVIKFLSV